MPASFDNRTITSHKTSIIQFENLKKECGVVGKCETDVKNIRVRLLAVSLLK